MQDAILHEENEEEEEELVSRIARNDPELTQLNIRCITNFQSPPVPDWWGIEPTDDVEDPKKNQFIRQQVERVEQALRNNTVITSFEIGPYVPLVMSDESCGYKRLVNALLRLENLREFRIDDFCLLHFTEIAGSLKAAKHLKKLSMPLRIYTQQDACAMDDFLRNHPTLESVRFYFDAELFYLHSRKSPPIQVLSRKELTSLCLGAYVTIPNLRELVIDGMHVSRAHLVQLVSMPNLRRLTILKGSVRDKHVISMANALVENNESRLEYLSISGGPFGMRRYSTDLTQDGWDALFHLSLHKTIEIHATAHYKPPPTTPRQQTSHNVSRLVTPFDINYFSFALNDEAQVERHLKRWEENRRLWMRHYGFDALLTQQDPPLSAFVDLMNKFPNDSIALFHILRANPTLCDVHGRKSVTVSSNGNKKRKRGGISE